MALNLDDLIGSMQHGFHAGDRGNDLNEIRENLKVTLGQHALGPAQSDAAQSGSRRPLNQRQWDGRTHAPSHSSLDGDVAMLSGSVENGASRAWHGYHLQQPANSSYGRSPMSMSHDQNGFGATYNPPGSSSSTGFGGPGSVGSQGSSTSSFGFGGFAQAPANTPQQTPVETSALARQLQAELERARDHQGSTRISEADERPDTNWIAQHSAGMSPSDRNDGSPSGYSHQAAAGQARADSANLTPRKLVNGFDGTVGSVGTEGLSPQGPTLAGNYPVGASQ